MGKTSRSNRKQPGRHEERGRLAAVESDGIGGLRQPLKKPHSWNSKRKDARKRQGGFTLIELLLVLGVMALLLAAGFWLWKEVNFRRAVTMEARNVQTVVATISSNAAAYRSTVYLGNDLSAPKGTWNMNLPACPGGWCNGFGGVTRVSRVSCWHNGMSRPHSRDNGFSVSYEDGTLDKRQCLALLNALGPARPAMVRVVNPGQPSQFFEFCEPGSSGCSTNGTRTSNRFDPAACSSEYQAPLTLSQQQDICSSETGNRFQLWYLPALGNPV